ncbi:menaquinol-cytochrome c reductase cytochrome c1 subunit precursor [Thermasporomyces composti]|uniref:Cytochrome bc1 complex cytochrome c subunit n=1 Tax=Thermasporomyces composti TaxID=696763 RepID=A0A3D9UZH5_THECX|nr:menaquinol-cytochrome c reductase cytochrome c1 subunit precursor [Thermasporomyces composti]
MIFGVRGRPRRNKDRERAQGRLSRVLSAHRRHRFAGGAVLLVTLVGFGGVYALASPPSQASEKAAQSTQIEEGRKLFAVSCSSCHGLDAQGTERGPSLIGVGAAAVDFQVGTGRMPAQNPAVQVPRKPPAFDEEETAALAAYVASLGPGPAVPSREDYDPEGLTDAEIAEGGELFRTNCASCHNVVGKGGALTWGRYAPNIQGVSPKHVYEAMLTGPQNMPVFADSVLTPEDKRKVIGYLDAVQSQPKQGGFTLGSMGPVTEGLAAWLGGIGVLVLIAIWIAAKTAKGKGAQAR